MPAGTEITSLKPRLKPKETTMNSNSTDYAHIPADACAAFAELYAKTGKADELRKITLPLVDLIRNDPKNLVYFFQEDRDSPGHFTFYELWASQSDFEAHNNTPYVKEWFAKLPALTDGELKATKMSIVRDAAN
jgi:quinol monooxygenase YgiN